MEILWSSAQGWFLKMGANGSSSAQKRGHRGSGGSHWKAAKKIGSAFLGVILSGEGKIIQKR